MFSGQLFASYSPYYKFFLQRYDEYFDFARKMEDIIKRWRFFLLSLTFLVFLTMLKSAGCFISYGVYPTVFFSFLSDSQKSIQVKSGEEWVKSCRELFTPANRPVYRGFRGEGEEYFRDCFCFFYILSLEICVNGNKRDIFHPVLIYVSFHGDA